jgi:hypothetical protein
MDPEGPFGGRWFRCCPKGGQLHWLKLFLASDGQEV